ncbi:MAG TPA: PhzF family phenazine biosynthesis protein [Spirochaetota bacterium]|nr:PhzF family phenazine biosynthesis protein [Spirochaetota bacterium]HOR45375.1 PhzF family phenazine biosynthesis protein [Spirochaetota bacterium]HPK57230.1 PhzF family phenazine biosynthesis protein [Spirochaetota bacterium]
MKRCKFIKMDVFAGDKSYGNPAAVFYPDEIITSEEMQKIGYELKGFVSEAVFIFNDDSGKSDYHLRYFSCEREVPFCGHGTVGALYDMLKSTEDTRPIITIRTMKGILEIENRISSEDSVYVTAPEPLFHDYRFDADEVSAALNIDSSAISGKFQLKAVNVGQNILLVPLKTLDDVVKCSPDYDSIRKYCLSHNVEIVNIYTEDVNFSQNFIRSRVFAPGFGYLEDPATGSANSALAYFLKKENIWNGNPFSIEQGVLKADPSLVRIIFKNNRVLFGGKAKTRIDGYYFLV